ncbi:MAG: metallophosphoesterase [Chloroflexi bacterium]|nr:metallophosphoesterase [Chloroflexota bacterium]
MLTFLHISDTHISVDPKTGSHELFAAAPHPNRCAEALVDAIRQLPFQIDFILHTGDVCADPLPENYRLALEILRRLEQPLILLPGNHDSLDLMREVLPDGERRRVVGDDHITIMGYHLLTIDGSGADNPLAPTLAEPQIERFAAEASRTQGQPILVAAHYPFIRTGVPWIDDQSRVQNGERIHDILARRRGQVAGVFFGHIHQAVSSVCDGVAYICSPSAWSNFAGYPGMRSAEADPGTPGGFNLVMIRENRSFIRRFFTPANDLS